MANIRVDFSGDNLGHVLKDINKKLQNEVVASSLQDLAFEFLTWIRFYAPKDTGQYAESWAIQNITEDSITIGTPMGELAVYLEYGTAPHPIVARKKKVLHWIGKDGKSHFAIYVRHPGFAPIKHIEPTIEQVKNTIENIISANINKILSRAE